MTIEMILQLDTETLTKAKEGFEYAIKILKDSNNAVFDGPMKLLNDDLNKINEELAKRVRELTDSLPTPELYYEGPKAFVKWNRESKPQ